MASYKLDLTKVSAGQNETCSLTINKKDCAYTSHYCEENIWMLTNKINEEFPEKLEFCHPIFISNENSHIPLWRQAASKQEDGLVVWDYHVIMVYYNEYESFVFDFDTVLPFPTSFEKYCNETFKSDEFLNPKYHRLFRVLSGQAFLKYFSSDRRHMMKEDGSWIKPPPTYPVIKMGVDHHNLEQYTSMKGETNIQKFGSVFKLKHFIEKFSSKPSSASAIDYTYPPEPCGF